MTQIDIQRFEKNQQTFCELVQRSNIGIMSPMPDLHAPIVDETTTLK
jgi:hypothetical protein